MTRREAVLVKVLAGVLAAAAIGTGFALQLQRRVDATQGGCARRTRGEIGDQQRFGFDERRRCQHPRIAERCFPHRLPARESLAEGSHRRVRRQAQDA